MFSFDSTNSREKDTTFFDNLEPRKFRMMLRRYKKDLNRKHSFINKKDSLLISN